MIARTLFDPLRRAAREVGVAARGHHTPSRQHREIMLIKCRAGRVYIHIKGQKIEMPTHKTASWRQSETENRAHSSVPLYNVHYNLNKSISPRRLSIIALSAIKLSPPVCGVYDHCRTSHPCTYCSKSISTVSRPMLQSSHSSSHPRDA